MNITNKLLGFVFKEKKHVNSDYLSVNTISTLEQNNIINQYTGNYTANGVVHNTGNSVNPYGDVFNNGVSTFAQKQNRILEYRQLLYTPEISLVVNEVVNECITTFGRNKQDKIVDIVLMNDDELINRTEISENVRTSFERIYDLLDFKNNGAILFKKWLVDGELCLYLHLDDENNLTHLELLEPEHLNHIVEYKGDEKLEYYVYKENLKLSYDSVVRVLSGYKDNNGNNVGYLENAIKFSNMLRMMEDSMMIYRVSRSPERRVFYIDTGDLPKSKAEQYVKEIANRYKTSISYDSATGKLRNKHNNIAITEDFWLARSSNGNATSIETLPSGQGGNDTTELDYFRTKLFESLRVPQSRFNRELMTQYTPNTQVSRDELRFYRLVHELRTNFNQLFLELIRTDLMLSGIVDNTIYEWNVIRNGIDFEYFESNYFADELDSERQRVNVSTYQQYIDLVERGYISLDYLYRNVMKLDDDEIKQMKLEIAKQKVNDDE